MKITTAYSRRNWVSNIKQSPAIQLEYFLSEKEKYIKEIKMRLKRVSLQTWEFTNITKGKRPKM
jgi:hypothetical protein